MNLSDLSKQMVITNSCVLSINNTLVQKFSADVMWAGGWNLHEISVSHSNDCE
jgi:hypothetical protein